jgi:hypothetical protein
MITIHIPKIIFLLNIFSQKDSTPATSFSPIQIRQDDDEILYNLIFSSVISKWNSFFLVQDQIIQVQTEVHQVLVGNIQ